MRKLSNTWGGRKASPFFFLEVEVIKRELTQFGKLLLILRDSADWGSESDLVVKTITVAEALAHLEALRLETNHESPWRLTRRRTLERLVEAVVPVGVLTWGSWIEPMPGAKRDPLLTILGVACPVVSALAPPRLPSKDQVKAQKAFAEALEARRESVGSC